MMTLTMLGKAFAKILLTNKSMILNRVRRRAYSAEEKRVRMNVTK